MGVPEPVRAALLPYVASRVVLLGTAVIANRYLPYGPPRDSARGTLLQGLLGWDSFHYLGIARGGYPAVAVAASGDNGYFPLLPLLIKVVGASDGAALVLALALGFAALVALAAFSATVWDDRTARHAIWGACFWPAGLYWSVPYTESLFLVLSLGTLWCAWRGRGAAAAGLAVLAALTRPTGIALVLPLLVLLPAGPRRLFAAAPIAGPVIFGAYIAWHTATPGALLAAFFSHGNLAPGRPWDALRTAELWARGGDWQQVAELPVVGAVAALVAGLARMPRWRGPALATVAAMLAPPLLAGTVSSFARYAMVAFPIYWPLRRAALPLLLAIEIPVAVTWTVFASTGHLTP